MSFTNTAIWPAPGAVKLAANMAELVGAAPVGVGVATTLMVSPAVKSLVGVSPL